MITLRFIKKAIIDAKIDFFIKNNALDYTDFEVFKDGFYRYMWTSFEENPSLFTILLSAIIRKNDESNAY